MQETRGRNEPNRRRARPSSPLRSGSLITGVVCGVRVEDVEDPLMREIRYTDKLIDELAKGKAMNKILRAAPGTVSR